MSNKQVFQGIDFNNQEVTELNAVQLLNDAVNPSQATRLSQVQQVSSDAVQAALVSSPSSASNDTAFTSATMAGFLAGKQDNMEIESSSGAYLEIVDGYKIKVKQLLISDVKVDEVHGTLSSYLAANTEDKQEGDVIILNAAIDNQERSWIKTGSASQTITGYTRLQTDYNVSSIRAMLSAGDYLNYSSSTGQFSVDLGTSSSKLGAHNLPVNPSEFTTVTGNTILDIAKNLESLINTGQQTQQQETQQVDTRVSSCVGVGGADLGSFGGRFSDNSSIKQVLQESEQDLTDSQTDRAAIRSEFAAADLLLENSIDAEVSNRQSAISNEASARNIQYNALSNADNTIANNLQTETSRATNAEQSLDSRLDIVEGSSSTTGSINKAQADAQSFATNIVSNEAYARYNADASLQTQIDAISSAFLYKGYINSEGRIVHIDPSSANNNALFSSATLFNGDFYKVNADITITFGDGSTISVESGDGLLAIKDVTSGNSVALDIHKTDNTESADLLREGMLDDVTLGKVAGQLKVIDDSIGRTQLDPAIETDIDNKVLKSGDVMTGSLAIDKVVTAGTGHAGGYDYAAFVKMRSVDTDSLTGTQRGLIVENEVHTDGSGSAFSLDYANAATFSSDYKGSSQDLTVAITGAYGEAKVTNNSSSIYATGSYSVATDDQLGVNAGGTFIAQNATTANLGMFAFSDTAGSANNRAGYFALAPDNLNFDGYRIARIGNPLPVTDAALVIDDYSGNKHALFVNGKSEFQGKVIVPNSTADNEAVNLSDIKNKEKIYSFDLVDGVSKVITTPASMNLDKVIWQVVDNNKEIDLSVTLDNSANTITVLANGDSLTGVTLLIRELSCNVEAV